MAAHRRWYRLDHHWRKRRVRSHARGFLPATLADLSLAPFGRDVGVGDVRVRRDLCRYRSLRVAGAAGTPRPPLTKRIAGCGCLALLGGIAVVGAMLHAMGLLPYVVAYGQFLRALASSPDARPANWVTADAQVINIEHRTDAHYRHLAVLVLRFADASGREQVRTFEVFSPSRGLGRTRNGDRLSIEVCRHDAAIVKSDRFIMSERRKCAPGVER